MTSTVSRPEIIDADPRTDSRWDELARGPLGSLFVSPPWISAVCDTYGFDAACRMQLDASGRPRGGLCWVPVADMCGERWLSLPFSDRADPPVLDAELWPRLAAGLARSEVPYTVRCFDTAVPAELAAIGAAGPLRRVRESAWHGTWVDDDLEETRARISAHARRNIRIAKRSGVTVSTSVGLDAMRRFYLLHQRLRQDKYRLLAQPWEFFERIWERFSAADAVVTALASVGDDVVAGAVFLVWEDVLYYKFGASRREHLSLRPNDAVFWTGLQLARTRNLRLLDWGLSDLGQPGLVAYKRKWAPEERTIVTLRGGGETAVPASEQRALLDRLTDLLTEPAVPSDVTERAGALLYRYFC